METFPNHIDRWIHAFSSKSCRETGRRPLRSIFLPSDTENRPGWEPVCRLLGNVLKQRPLSSHPPGAKCRTTDTLPGAAPHRHQPVTKNHISFQRPLLNRFSPFFSGSCDLSGNPSPDGLNQWPFILGDGRVIRGRYPARATPPPVGGRPSDPDRQLFRIRKPPGESP